MKELNAMPVGKRRSGEGLTVPQVRVLQMLATIRGRGALTRTALSERIGNKTTVVVGRAIGYSDPEKRAAFERSADGGGTSEKPCPSLLTLGFVEEVEVRVADGPPELGVRLTPQGREALKACGKVNLAPLKE